MPYSGFKWGNSALGTNGGVVEWSFADFLFSDAHYAFFSTSASFRAVIQRAFDIWEAIANIDFRQVADSSTNDMRVGFGTLDGSEGPIAGQAFTVFSSGSVRRAELAMDVDERWVQDGDDFVIQDSGASFLAVAIHEIGHAIGLDHEDGVPSIMGSVAVPGLVAPTAVDIALIRSIYGAAGSTPSPSTGAPVITVANGASSGQVTVSENNTGITTLTASDPNGDALLWSIASGADAARFTIDPVTGALSFRSLTDFEKPKDANRDNVYDVVVAVSDGALTDEISLAVKVADVAGVRTIGTSANDRISGTGEADVLAGRGGHDVIKGGEGADRIIGGTGRDKMFAGADDGSTDRFVFVKGDSGLMASTRDQIFDFVRDTDGRNGIRQAGSDRIDLSGIDADTAPGDQALRFVSKFSTASKNQADGQVMATKIGGNILVQVDWNGDKRADMSILVADVVKLTADDFIL